MINFPSSPTEGQEELLGGKYWTYTAGRWVLSSVITPTITDGDTTHAPDGNSVFDALALKVDGVTSPSADWHTHFSAAGSFFYEFNGAANQPAAGSNWAGLGIPGFNANNSAIVAVSLTASPRISIKTNLAGTPQPWTTLWHSTRSSEFDTDNIYNIGSSAARAANIYSRQLRPGAGTAIWTSGSGSPEGSITAPVGSLYTRTDGGAGTTLYVKESGAGNTGWVAK